MKGFFPFEAEVVFLDEISKINPDNGRLLYIPRIFNKLSKIHTSKLLTMAIISMSC